MRIEACRDFPEELSPPPVTGRYHPLPMKWRVSIAARRVHCLYFVRRRRKLKGHSADYWRDQARS